MLQSCYANQSDYNLRLFYHKKGSMINKSLVFWALRRMCGFCHTDTQKPYNRII